MMRLTYQLEPGSLQDLEAASIAVLIPCFNEAATIADVVVAFRTALPDAAIYVYDNNSKDGTADAARQAGAIVRTEKAQGKGNVVRRMFSDVEADIYVMVDGDGTYEPAKAPALVEALVQGPCDLVNGARIPTHQAAYRPGHVFGNKLLNGLVAWLFTARHEDMLSGYKAMSRRFVKSFPAESRGFETETELLIHAVELRVPYSEVAIAYSERPSGSVSKLNTIRDGLRILRFIVYLVKKERPLQFFSLVALACAAASIALGAPVVLEYLHTGLVPRLPTAVLAVGVMLTGLFCLFAGLILDVISESERSAKRRAYLSYPAPVALSAPAARRRSGTFR
jgi:glycosyltransferase involved in cell wall biosynthesis